MSTLENICVKLDLITVEHMKCYTTLELLMMVIKRLNEVIDKINDIDLNLLSQLRVVIAELVDNGTISSLLADEVYDILNKRIGDKRSIDEYQNYAINDNWGLALQQAINEGYKNIIFTKGNTYSFKTQNKDEDGLAYSVLIEGKSNITLDGNGCTITVDYREQNIPCAIYFRECEDIVVKNFTIKGVGSRLESTPSTPLYSGCAIKLWGVKRSQVLNNKVHQMSYLVDLHWCEHFTIRDNIYTHDTYNEAFQSTRVPYSAVLVYGSKRGLIENNTIYGGLRDGDISLFGLNTDEVNVVHNYLSARGYNAEETDYGGHNLAQAITVDQGCKRCNIHDNYVFGYYYGIDVKSNVHDIRVHDNVVEGCKISIADRNGEYVATPNTDTVKIHDNIILLTKMFGETSAKHEGYDMVGIFSEQRYGTDIVGNTIKVSEGCYFPSGYVLCGVFYSQRDINDDYKTSGRIEQNDILFTLGTQNGVYHAPDNSVMIHLKATKWTCVNLNGLKSSYSKTQTCIKLTDGNTDGQINLNKVMTNGANTIVKSGNVSGFTTDMSDVND